MLEATVWSVLAMNFLTFMTFGFDKRRANRRGRRVPEATLLLLAWATGVLGAWLGVSVFRHKTRKTSFRIKLVLVTIANLLWLVVWLHLR